MRRSTYTIEFKENGEWEEPKREMVVAGSASEAYMNFMDLCGWNVYSAWVASVTYKNGNHHEFNNFSGKPY